MTCPAARTTVTIPSQPAAEIEAERAGVWWQLDGKHLLFCGEPNSRYSRCGYCSKFLYYCFQPLPIGSPQLMLRTWSLCVSSLLIKNGAVRRSLEAAILYWWKGDNLVVSCFVPSVKILALSRLSPGSSSSIRMKVLPRINNWLEKMGVKVQQLSSEL